MTGVLVDSSIWIDHLHRADAELTRLLVAGRVLGHPFVRGELAMGSLADRANVLDLVGKLPQSKLATADEVALMIEQRTLYGRGLGYVDAHLLASTAMTPLAKLWARDKRLAKTATDLGVGYEAGC